MKMLTLEYNLAELPSSQHRAGLAGLVLMTRWLADEPDKKGVCEITQISNIGAAFQLDKEGLQSLFDKVYAAFWKTIETDKKPTNKKTQFKAVEREVIDEETGRVEKKTFYTKKVVTPLGAFLVDYDPTASKNEGIWINLWRDALWATLRSRDRQQIPYQKRVETQEISDAGDIWKMLSKSPNKEEKLASTLYVGAEDSNPENVQFKDRSRVKLLLHFWFFIAQIYVPKIYKFDKKKNTEEPKDFGFALAIPDVADLENFCEILPDVLQDRSTEKFGYRPKESIVDIAAESGLDLLSKINRKLSNKININLQDLILGVDVFHLEKKGNNVRLWATSRIDPTIDIDLYRNIKERFTSPLFRRQKLLNLLNDRPPFDGFGALLSKTDAELTVGSKSWFFSQDARTAFEIAGVQIKSKGANEMDTETQEISPKTIAEIVYKLVFYYILAKLDSKYGLVWKKVKETSEGRKKYNEMKGKIAREAFLAIRSRTDSDFIEYFVSTLCAFPQFLREDGYLTLTTALHNDTEKTRTLTMLALSANGYSPKEKKEESQ